VDPVRLHPTVNGRKRPDWAIALLLPQDGASPEEAA